ncbi:YqhA family protein [Hyphomicrobium sp. D-2]|uniref:YqhA family protein n=1 Tax=Hyphomicrobium sp. D-2 TaxID=3041621 RepID=UPI0024553A25|nr:YqhA family protein [Hyphomicrobium sp. D-2]MDH4981622.1 YqhA family protein [Hyphomicrobium sp. D-2]
MPLLRYLVSLRFVLLIAAIGTAVGAIIMFLQASLQMIGAAIDLLKGEEPKIVTAMVMGATDTYLFGIVLVIFSYAIAFGFVFYSGAERLKLPSWMRPTGMDELKMTLISVIIVYLVVDFATDWAEKGSAMGWETLVKPISILLLAASLRLFTGHGASTADDRTAGDAASGKRDEA